MLEEGTHTELMANRSLYHTLVTTHLSNSTKRVDRDESDIKSTSDDKYDDIRLQTVNNLITIIRIRGWPTEKICRGLAGNWCLII